MFEKYYFASFVPTEASSITDKHIQILGDAMREVFVPSIYQQIRYGLPPVIGVKRLLSDYGLKLL